MGLKQAAEYSSGTGEKPMEDLRQQFEKWITSAPFEKSIARFPDDETRFAWPGNYRELDVELAWQAWQEAAKVDAE